MMRWGFIALILSSLSFSAQVVTDRTHSTCEEFVLVRELKIYKDPTLFIPNLSLIYSDPKMGWDSLMDETPLLTTLKGSVHMMVLGEAVEFKNFGAISRLYELAEPKLRLRPSPSPSPDKEPKLTRPKIIPIKICSEGYGDSLGFVLESELKLAQTDERDGYSLPPSTRKNPVPRLR